MNCPFPVTISGAMVFPADGSGKLELVAEGFSFPTSLTFDEVGVAYVAESGLPFGGAPPGGRVWRLAGDGRCLLLAEGLRPPVNGLTFHAGGLYVKEWVDVWGASKYSHVSCTIAVQQGAEGKLGVFCTSEG
jgi:sugar lactone lactonase YvrE